MKLINPTDDELNATFAEKVAGLKIEHGEYHHDHPYLGRAILGGSGPGVSYGEGTNNGGFQKCAPYTESADAVLPWVKSIIRVDNNCDVWTVVLHYGYTITDEKTGAMKAKEFTGWARTYHDKNAFAKALVIALLRAHGVEVDFTP